MIITADFSTETLRARRVWDDVFQVLKENNCQPIFLCLVKLTFILEGEIKTFHDKQKLKEFVNTKLALQNKVKAILYTEEEDKCTHENTEENKSHQTSR
jgi:hypothetical protein